jgi:threonine dehydrogenase-like Zn-dependent dehydrogenase
MIPGRWTGRSGVNPANVGRKVPHGAILKYAATCICGSDQHMAQVARGG